MTGPLESFSAEAPQVSTLETVLDDWMGSWSLPMPEQVKADLLRRLRTREDNMADVLRLAGVQFGLFSEIVAEVLAEVGLGTPIDDNQRMFIRRQFAELMQRLREEHERGEHG